MPSCGDLLSHFQSIRSARGSTVVRGSGPTTLSLTGRERCRKGCVLHALSPLLGERDRAGRSGGSMGLIRLSDHSRTPSVPPATTKPSRPSRPT